MVKELISYLEEQGYRAKIASASRVGELLEEIESRYEGNQIREEIYRDYLKFERTNIKESGALLSIAVKLPIIKLKFTMNNQEIPIIVPPGYIGADIVAKLKNDVDYIMNKNNLSYAKCKLPQKLLASRTGLGKYGRNNIIYVEGLGSLIMLFSYFVDVPCENSFVEPQIAQECTDCCICKSSCPTGALNKLNFIVDTSKCIALANEVGREFGEWIKPKQENSLLGCFYCQGNCPMNKPYLSDVRIYPTFTEKETVAFYNKEPLERLSKETHQKLKDIELYDSYELFTHNLKVLLDKYK